MVLGLSKFLENPTLAIHFFSLLLTMILEFVPALSRYNIDSVKYVHKMPADRAKVIVAWT